MPKGSYTKSLEHRAKISATIKAKTVRGKSHPLFHHGSTNSHTIHAWMLRNFIKTGTCEICGATPERKRRSPTQFAFKNHPAPYTRERRDYYEACIPCHRALDRASYVGKKMPPRESALVTPAERDILTRLAAGALQKQVAADRGQSYQTVTWHLTQVRRKLGARNTTHAVAIAWRKGLL